MKKIVIFGAALILTVAGFVYWYGFLRKETPIEKMKPDFELSADSLLSQFLANEKNATEKFVGKILLLKSTIFSVEKDDRGNISLILIDPISGVTCSIDSLQAIKQKSLIQSLSEGQPIMIKGRCDGMLTDVKISRCMIIH